MKNCGVWEVEARNAETRNPVSTSIPTLILAGQLDSMTPPAWAHEAAQTWSNSYVYEIPGFGHSPTFYGACPGSMALQFLQDPTATPDDSCISEMKIDFKLPDAN
jgi:hypothetical protein